MKKIDIENDSASESAVTESSEPVMTVDAANVTREQLEELKERAAKTEEHWERLVRTTADLDNYKKRATREKQDAIKYANESLLQKLIPILDNFDMAMAATQNADNETVQSLQK